MSAPALPTLKVGDKVRTQPLNPRTDSYREQTVTKVGRKWIELDNRSSEQYSIETGYVNGHGYMSYSRIVTQEILAYEEAHAAAWARLRSIRSGITLGYSDLTVDQLNRIADILEEAP